MRPLAITHGDPEALFRGIVEQSPAPTQVHMPDGECILVNRAWERLWGVTLEQIHGYNVLEDAQLVEKGVMPYILRGFAGEMVTVPPIKYVPELTRPGVPAVPYRWVTSYLYPVFDDAGRVAMVVMTGEDVTAQIDAEIHLREAEEQYRGIFNATGEGLLIVDGENMIVEANPAFCRMHGFSRDDLVGRHASVILAPERLPYLDEATRAVEERGEYRTEGRDARSDGATFPVEVHATRFSYRGRPHILSVVRDISERAQAYELLERRVAERTRELEALLEISHDMASTLELRPLLRLILDRLQSIVGYTGASVLVIEGDQVNNLYRYGPGLVDDGAAFSFPLAAVPHTWAAIARGESIVVDDVRSDAPLAREYRAVNAAQPAVLDFVRSWMALPLVTKDQVIGAVSLASSEPGYFTERDARLAQAIANQAAVAIEHARLYARAQALAAVEERQRLARELHDSVSQSLYGIALGVHTARSLLDRDPRRVAEPLEYIQSLAKAGMAEMRALIFELRPDALRNEGLVAALGKQVELLRARHGLIVEADLGEEPEEPLEVKEAIYRIAQEALHNIVKHANAARIRLGLARSESAITLEVADDGQGFDPAQAFPGHLGLHTMRDRAERLGGSIDLTSAIGCGTQLRVCIPVRRTPGA